MRLVRSRGLSASVGRPRSGPPGTKKVLALLVLLGVVLAALVAFRARLGEVVADCSATLTGRGAALHDASSQGSDGPRTAPNVSVQPPESE
jgi:hypothetical protein